MKSKYLTLNQILKTFNLKKEELQWIYDHWDKLELIEQIFTVHYHPDYEVNDDYFVWFINPQDYEDYYVFDRQNEDFFGIIAPIIKDKFQLYTYNQLSNAKWFNNFKNIELFSLYDCFKYFIIPLKEFNYTLEKIDKNTKFKYDWKNDKVFWDYELDNELDNELEIS